MHAVAVPRYRLLLISQSPCQCLIPFLCPTRFLCPTLFLHPTLFLCPCLLQQLIMSKPRLKGAWLLILERTERIMAERRQRGKRHHHHRRRHHHRRQHLHLQRPNLQCLNLQQRLHHTTRVTLALQTLLQAGRRPSSNGVASTKKGAVPLSHLKQQRQSARRWTATSATTTGRLHGQRRSRSFAASTRARLALRRSSPTPAPRFVYIAVATIRKSAARSQDVRAGTTSSNWRQSPSEVVLAAGASAKVGPHHWHRCGLAWIM